MVIASTVTFDDGSNPAVTINGPAQASSYQISPLTVSDQSGNYDVRSYQLTSTVERLWTLTFNNVTEIQKNDFVNFFTTEVIGPGTVFTYTHTDGTAYTNVRFMNDSLSIERTEPGIFSISVTLKLDGQNIT